MANCSSCGAEIVWAKSAATGKAIPLDAKPEKRFYEWVGTIESGSAEVALMDTYQTHFATCPNAAQHRKPKDATPR